MPKLGFLNGDLNQAIKFLTVVRQCINWINLTYGYFATHCVNFPCNGFFARVCLIIGIIGWKRSGTQTSPLSEGAAVIM